MRTIIAAILLTIGAAAQQTIYEPGNGVALPQVVKSVKADYTQEARDAHIEGTVLLAVVVNADGNVGDVAIERSLDPTYGLDEQAVKAAKQWLFKPGMKDGAAVAVRVRLEMTFTLK